MPLVLGYAQNETPEAPRNLLTTLVQNKNEGREAFDVQIIS
jgi:hypothetical protein